METETIGRVLTEATIESLEDLWDERRGRSPGSGPPGNRADAWSTRGHDALDAPALIDSLASRSSIASGLAAATASPKSACTIPCG